MKQEPARSFASIAALEARGMMNPVAPRANVLSALLGLFSVFVFTRLLTAHDYGVCLLGVGFASVIAVALIARLRSLASSENGKNNGSAFRGLLLCGYFVA